MTGLSKETVKNLKSPLAKQVDFHEEIGSTQERARELAKGHPGAPHGTIVISNCVVPSFDTNVAATSAGAGDGGAGARKTKGGPSGGINGLTLAPTGATAFAGCSRHCAVSVVDIARSSPGSLLPTSHQAWPGATSLT